jgi:hypothetical protein
MNRLRWGFGRRLSMMWLVIGIEAKNAPTSSNPKVLGKR